MPTPTQTGFNITVELTTAHYPGETIKITNLSRSVAPITIDTQGVKDAPVINPKDSSTSWQEGDEVIVEIHGRIQGYAIGTLGAHGKKLKMNDAADASSQSVEL